MTKLRASVLLGVLTALIAALLSTGIAGAVTFTAAELEFADDTADYTAGQVEVPVECVGGPTGICSGSLTLSWRGKRTVTAFSVQGGNRDTIVMSLPREIRVRPAKVAAVATTTQPLGPAVTRKTILHLE